MRLRRPSASLILFLALVLGVALWIGSGVLTREPARPPVAEERPVPIVAVAWSEAEPVERLLRLYGDVEPDQVVVVRAETSGQIAEVTTQRGARVEPGAELARIAPGDREARLRRAEARLAAAQREFDIAEQLVERGTAPETRLQTATAELEATRADLSSIRVEIENTVIRAPIGGIVNRIIAETGDFVAVGGEVVEIVDNDPLVAVVQVPQHAVGRIRPGGEARVGIVGRESVAGTIRFVAPLAEAATRTFRVEIEVPNPEGDLPAGVSAEVVIPTETVEAHKVSPSLVTLDDEGAIGLFAVGEDGTVEFHPVQLVRAEADGVWVTGPPERVRLITIRPGFVSEGQAVDARQAAEEGQEGTAAPVEEG